VDFVKKVSSVVLTSLLFVSSLASARPIADGNQFVVASVKGVELCGKLSADGKVLLADDDNEWRITNAEVLKGREGRYVTVKCRMNVNKHSIRVLMIEDPAEQTHAARLGDAAFRR
jgi:hypothetical protein